MYSMQQIFYRITYR